MRVIFPIVQYVCNFNILYYLIFLYSAKKLLRITQPSSCFFLFTNGAQSFQVLEIDREPDENYEACNFMWSKQRRKYLPKSVWANFRFFFVFFSIFFAQTCLFLNQKQKKYPWVFFFLICATELKFGTQNNVRVRQSTLKSLIFAIY